MTHKDNDKADLIPDYCNNRLTAQEKDDFERLLLEDRDLLDACRDFQHFQKLYRQLDPAEPQPSAAVFDRISGKVRVEQAVTKNAHVQPNLAESVRRFWRQLRASMTVPWMLAAAQAVVIVLLLVPAPEQNTYVTLSSSEQAADAERAGINVVFRPDAAEADIRSLLQAVQGSISSGPSREGRYMVSILEKSELEQAVRTLKQSNIVLFAEPAS